MPIRVVLDTDPGIDDSLAILLALASPEIDLAAVGDVWPDRQVYESIGRAGETDFESSARKLLGQFLSEEQGIGFFLVSP